MEGRFSAGADVFSLGISILEVACDLQLPSNGESWHMLRRGELPEDFIKSWRHERERGREGEREGGREREREGGREGGREGEKGELERERVREREREGERATYIMLNIYILFIL